jgi:hypothetical protein
MLLWEHAKDYTVLSTGTYNNANNYAKAIRTKGEFTGITVPIAPH